MFADGFSSGVLLFWFGRISQGSFFVCACVFVEFDFPSKISGDVAAMIQ